MFKEVIVSILDEYPTTDIFNTTPVTSHALSGDLIPNKRRKRDIILNLVRMVGESIELYNEVLQNIRSKFVKTHLSAYGTLRTDFVMALQDAEVVRVYSEDPCHKFTWCLSACVREQTTDMKRIKEMLSVIRSLNRSPAMGDIAMMVADTFAMHTLTVSLYAVLKGVVQSGTVPRESEHVQGICSIITLGTHALDMMNARKFDQPSTERLLSVVLPSFCAILAEDILAREDSSIVAKFTSAVTRTHAPLAIATAAKVRSQS